MKKNIHPTKYTLRSVLSGKEIKEEGWTLDSPFDEEPTLIRAEYEHTQMNPGSLSEGIYRFSDWLPISRTLNGSSSPITYKSQGLAKELGLNNLYITFSGYWPEKECYMKTCSFKETEAYSVSGRMGESFDKVLVVASAGNTARAFAKVCSENNIPVLICIPEDNLNALWFDKPLNDCVKVIASKTGSDYFDAIHLSNLASEHPKYIMEGGAKNIARRDGMATTTLSAITTIGKIPDFYFQSVGSGTGAIAAHEANIRMINDGRYGSNLMKLILSQNKPFLAMYDSWKADKKTIDIPDMDIARKQASEIDAKVLSNRKPPYGIAGGVYDVLKATDGDFIAVSNEEQRAAAKLFKETEGIDIHPAAGVATASLIQYVKNSPINPESIIMLNITGGGEELFKSKHEMHYQKAHHVFAPEATKEEVFKVLDTLF